MEAALVNVDDVFVGAHELRNLNRYALLLLIDVTLLGQFAVVRVLRLQEPNAMAPIEIMKQPPTNLHAELLLHEQHPRPEGVRRHLIQRLWIDEVALLVIRDLALALDTNLSIADNIAFVAPSPYD